MLKEEDGDSKEEQEKSQAELAHLNSSLAKEHETQPEQDTPAKEVYARSHDTDTGTVNEGHLSNEGLLYVLLARGKVGLTHGSLAEKQDKGKDLGHQDPKHALNFAQKKLCLRLNESHA